MPIWVMKRIPWPATTVAIHAMAVIRRKSRPNMEKPSFPYLVTGLEERLASAGYDGHQRSFTPAHVRIIVEAIDEP